MDSINTLGNNICQVIRICLNDKPIKPLKVIYKPVSKPAAYKSINSSSINIFLK